MTLYGGEEREPFVWFVRFVVKDPPLGPTFDIALTHAGASPAA
jgi:hypothetical protein